ncbi:sensor histidine kinase [Pedobacter glucosidilyticus]|uniref:sensor histidine kinase n=1 Tax=Pedobacter glucosidilyticus TaxID=1122941 RepID=UPI00041F317C|nr:7TM diverse intracellular signaling domain-containing protein [Pedobacter glucosidilyticus]
MRNKLLLFLILCCSYTYGLGQHKIIFKNDNSIIGHHIAILQDDSKKLSFNDILNNQSFKPSGAETIILPLSDANFWLKFTIKNQSNQNKLLLMIESSYLDNSELYYQRNGVLYFQKISNTKKFNARKYKHQHPTFDLNIAANAEQTYYLKVNSHEQMFLPIYIGKEQKISEYLNSHDIFWGVLIGILMVMILYNSFLYLSTKDISYVYYVLYTLFTLLTQITLSGHSFKYLFSNTPYLFNKALIIFPGLAGIMGVIFIRLFLQSKTRTPKLNKLFIVSLVVYASAIVARIIGFDLLSYRLIDIVAIYTIIVIYTVAITITVQGYRPAKFFLIAWSGFFIGLIIFILKNSGLLPYNTFTNYSLQIGTALEVTLLSLALADRINILKKEKEQSQAQALEIAKENERIIKEQNTILEQRVKERTVELIETNNELSHTLEDLKQAQTQLVEAEKMASLGQLTAGIAHEINNPINFVTSNVSPLLRDVNMLFDAVDLIEKIGLSDKTIQEKQQEIEEYKEELDYDYLKMEINHLLKGIHEGASRTAEIVKGLRIFSRVDEDDLKRADINEGIESTLVIMNNLLNNSNIKVEKNYAALPLVECYPGKLNQVFLNIISNAIHAINVKHTHSKDGLLSIKTTATEDVVNIYITDNGCGMSDTTRNKIFDPFFTTKDVGEGTGLGMSIAYNTIKKHNGQIFINTEPDKGTEFIIKIPVIHQIMIS